MYVDVHTHLTHHKFAGILDEVVQRARAAGLGAIVCNGLNPKSNEAVIQMSKIYPEVVAAAGIYPLDGVARLLPKDFELQIEAFDVDAAIAQIDAWAETAEIQAIGECGLDAYWPPVSTHGEQERVFEALIDIAKRRDLPLIIHTRKMERRSMEILRHHKVKRVNFHCYGGKVKMALRAAEQDGWWFSIPANARNSEAFTKMLRELPVEKILTETDAPYLAPQKGEQSEPANVAGTVAYFAEIRGLDVAVAKQMIWQNYQDFIAS